MKSWQTEGKISEPQQLSGKKYRKIAIAVISVFVIFLLAAVVIFIKPMLEKKIIKEQIAKYMEEIKTGYLSELDYDIPAEVYVYATSGLNSYVKSVIDYVLGGEESLKRGWQDIMKDMEYSVDSIEKDESGNYIISITFTNRNLGMILTKTAEDIKDEKGKWILDAVSGKMSERFWKSFENNRDAVADTVSKSYQLRIEKDKDGNWTLDTEQLDFGIFGSMAGLEDQYLDMMQPAQNESASEENIQ